MTSKEAVLELICEAKSLNRDDGRVCFLRKTIEKDLERLEKLEKAIETLKKSFLLSVRELHGIYYVLAYDNNYVMTKEEYDLLREVLEDEN